MFSAVFPIPLLLPSQFSLRKTRSQAEEYISRAHGKAGFAPLKQHTITKLELQAALIGARRVGEILDLYLASHRKHCPGNLNTLDD